MQWIAGVLAGLKALNPLKLARRNIELETKDAQREQELLAVQDKLRKADSALQQKATTHITPRGYLRQDGDETAYCATCFQTKIGILVSLEPPERWNGGVRRCCPVCFRVYWDEPETQTRGAVYLGRYARRRR